MHFLHLADVHIGAWKHPALTHVADENFLYAIQYAIQEDVDFILIAGDLFDSALPGIGHLQETVKTLSLAREAQIPVYLIPGSHDYSPSGKSVLGVLVEAGLAINVYTGTVVDEKLQLTITNDTKTGVQLTGMLGRKGTLETQHYQDLDKDYLQKNISQDKESIFLFHSAIDELKPPKLQQMNSSPVSMMPKGFTYYAGGHVHITENISLSGYAQVAYPGPLFPASFSELEQLGGGHFIEYKNKGIERKKVPNKEIYAINIHSQNNTPEEITQKSIEQMTDIQDKIVLLRIQGILRQGNVADIDFKRITTASKEAYVLLRNTVGLRSEDQAEPHLVHSSAEELEHTIFMEHAGSSDNIYAEHELQVMKELMKTLCATKQEGETNTTYEERIVGDGKKILKLS